MTYEVVIIGGGLAGLSAAIDLSKKGIAVCLIEKTAYPRHKVCGEYVSNEVLAYLHTLGFDPYEFGAHKIKSLAVSNHAGQVISSPLKMGGFSLSRYRFDKALADLALKYGVHLRQDSVIDIKFLNDQFSIITKNGNHLSARLVIGAHGKRSIIDKKIERAFIQKSAPFLAVKAHYYGEFPDHVVALHNFSGGYCGLSKVENNTINACYIVDYASFKKFKNIATFQKKVMAKNPHLKHFFENSTLIFEQVMSIGQISFLPKQLISKHILMCGDSAGMIHPLCGNGMSMAIQSAQILSALIADHLDKPNFDRLSLENQYRQLWNKSFKSRIRTGRVLARLFRYESLSKYLLYALGMTPRLLPKIIDKTHGKPLVIS